MKNNKNRKRLLRLMMAFLLMFLAGAAFAFSPGQLTLGGAVNLAPSNVIWYTAVPSVSGSALQITSEVDIQAARGRDRQHIEWEVDFGSPGRARLDVSALNQHESLGALVTLNVTATSPIWNHPAFGLTIGGNFQDSPEVIPAAGTVLQFPVPTLPGTRGLERYIWVDWDGTLPAGFDDTVHNPAHTFIITFDYTAAP